MLIHNVVKILFSPYPKEAKQHNVEKITIANDDYDRLEIGDSDAIANGF